MRVTTLRVALMLFAVVVVFSAIPAEAQCKDCANHDNTGYRCWSTGFNAFQSCEFVGYCRLRGYCEGILGEATCGTRSTPPCILAQKTNGASRSRSARSLRRPGAWSR